MFEAGLKYQETVTMVTEVCCNCGIAFGMPSNLVRVLRDDPEKSFYCPNGHGQHYREPRTEKQLKQAQQEAERLRTQLTQKDSINAQLEGVIKRQKAKLDRVEKGVCPCCNRTFKNLARHMENKHGVKSNQNEKRVG